METVTPVVIDVTCHQYVGGAATGERCAGQGLEVRLDVRVINLPIIVRVDDEFTTANVDEEGPNGPGRSNRSASIGYYNGSRQPG